LIIKFESITLIGRMM